MTGEIIKSFLVGLGFEVDNDSLSKFNKSIAGATLKVAAFATAIEATAVAVGYGISKISQDFEDLGYEYKIIAPAINKAIILRQEMLKAYAAAGVNLNQVVVSAVKFNLSITKTKYALEAIYKSVGARFFPLLTKQADIFRRTLYENMPKIQASLEKAVKFLFKFFDATIQLGQRAWSIFTRGVELLKPLLDILIQLDKATNGWLSTIAFTLGGLAALSSVFGPVITGLLVLLGLFDDYKTWKEGGNSLFDWTSFVPVIDAVTETLSSLYGILENIAKALGEIVAAFVLLFQGNYSGAFDALKESAMHLLGSLEKVWDSIKGIMSSIGAIGEWGGHFFGNQNAAQNLQATPSGIPYANPAAHMSNSQSNQNLSQQTNINIVGSADAGSVGKHVASEQNKVNLDMSRYLRARTQ